MSSPAGRAPGPPGHPRGRLPRTASRLHSAAIRLLRGLRKADAATGLGPARLSALSVLVFGGPCSIGELAKAEQVRAPTMTRIVSGLEGTGLAVRDADPADGRIVRVRATARGVRRLEAERRRRIDRLVGMLASLPRRDLERLEGAAAILERLLREG